MVDFDELFHLVIENVKDYAIFFLDPSGHAVTWNAGVKRLLKYDEDEFVGLPFHALFLTNEQEFADEELQKAASNGRSDDQRWLRAKDGTDLWVTGVLTALRDPAGELRGYVKIMRDTTSERRSALEREELLQRELAARTEAERANRMKDEFLATVSHELRTPLNAILGWARMLVRDQLDQSAAKRALAAVERNAVAQSRLIEGLLDLSRIVSGRLQLDLRPVSLPELLNAAFASVQHAADAKGVSVSTAIVDSPIELEADGERLQQVVLNLLSNAIKFTPSGGSVVVQVTRHDGVVELTVRDSGAGIPPEILPHIFDRFRQASPGHAPADGLGLGLTIARHLVEAHGGSIEAQSDGSGNGATFVVRLPLANGSPAEASSVSDGSQPLAYAPELAGRSVLVVEDHADSREFAKFVLERSGMHVVTTDSAFEALKLLDANDIDLIVSDISLPGEADGFELLRKVRSRPGPAGRIPAIVVSAHTDGVGRAAALAAGYQRHLSKPVEPVELIQAVSAVLRPSPRYSRNETDAGSQGSIAATPAICDPEL